ncbi:MAG: hypothetical protein HC822_06230 [Oscillochloris sp.]|nr:hypothetical protein [Oscillochloris sp.]
MQLLLRANGRQAAVIMEQAGDQVLTVGEYRYHLASMARHLRRLAERMWGAMLTPEILSERMTFEAIDNGRNPVGDSGSFSPRSGSYVALGRWDEQGSIGIALHELAHEMHMRSGGYDQSDGVLREAISLMAERESGLRRTFEREPYYTASNLINQICELSAFGRQSFPKRWAELNSVQSETGLADLVNYYLDKSERLGLGKWLQRYSPDLELRDALMSKLALTSSRYSLEYRRCLLKAVTRCTQETAPDRLFYVLDSVVALDRRYPGDDLERIIEFCFAPYQRPQRRLFAFG